MSAGRYGAIGLGTVLAIGLLALSAPIAWASGDICAPALALNLNVKGDCDNIAALTPGNDTRVNLLLMLLDRHGIPTKPPATEAGPVLDWHALRDDFFAANDNGGPSFASGEGSRCRSNDSGTAAFEAAIKAATGLTPEERAALSAARGKLAPDCAADKGANGAVDEATKNAQSPAAKSFVTYLHGVDAFYGARFDEAAKNFGSLKANADPWLADTAAYMAARTEVNHLQDGAFDQYGSFKGSESVDKRIATQAEASLNAYLKERPKGRYIDSARGLLRRVDWLAGWKDKLAAQYAELLAKPAATRGLDDVALVEEIDNKLLPDLTADMTKDPILLAALDLKQMRKATGKPTDPPHGGTLDLEAQRPVFETMPDLYTLLVASKTFYIDGASSPILKQLPDDTKRHDGDYLWFSRQLLRGKALEALGDRNTRGFWMELHPGATRMLDESVIQLALALHDESHNRLKDVFAAESLIKSPTLRNVLLENTAGPTLLRAQAHDRSVADRERKLALFTLLYKGLTRGRYEEFLADLKDVAADAPMNGGTSPDPAGTDDPPLGLFLKGATASEGDIECPSLAVTAARLGKEPESIKDRLCLAEFIRLNGLDDDPLDKQPPAGQLGSAATQFPGKPYARADLYKTIIAKGEATATQRAYALYRAVKCYEPTGNNQCGGPTVPKSERRSWFNELKRKYPNSRWAQDLSYWW